MVYASCEDIGTFLKSSSILKHRDRHHTCRRGKLIRDNSAPDKTRYVNMPHLDPIAAAIAPPHSPFQDLFVTSPRLEIESLS